MDLDFETVLEIGCGPAPLLDAMQELGKKTTGVTLGGEQPKHKVIRQDMHFLDMANNSYDLVAARHVLEHSPIPLPLLMEMHRIAKKYALVVLPAPSKRMINWVDHYFAMPRENWERLFKVAGWKVQEYREVRLYYEPSTDEWDREYQYLLTKS